MAGELNLDLYLCRCVDSIQLNVQSKYFHEMINNGFVEFDPFQNCDRPNHAILQQFKVERINPNGEFRDTLPRRFHANIDELDGAVSILPEIMRIALKRKNGIF